jgi:hypothetical protein
MHKVRIRSPRNAARDRDEDDYSACSSIDGEEERPLHRAGSSLAAAEARLQVQDRDCLAKLHAAAPSSSPPPPAYSRQQTTSGVKVPCALSFYQRHAHTSTAKGKRGALGSADSKQQMLTCDQLSDLFRRLDRNGNGTLEKSEFMEIVKKLRLEVSEQFLLGVFQEVDAKTKVKGTLTLRDFIQCYQILYLETTTSAASAKHAPPSLSLSGPGAAPRREQELVETLHAVRYGHDASSGQYIYEVYSGHSEGGSMVISEKKTFGQGGATGTGTGMGRYEAERVDMDLGHLNLLMAQDSQRNAAGAGGAASGGGGGGGKDGGGGGSGGGGGGRSQLFWWLDVAMQQVQSSAVEKYIVSFGLPNDSRFRSRFSQFGDPLPREANGNFYAGNGACSRLGSWTPGLILPS